MSWCLGWEQGQEPASLCERARSTARRARKQLTELGRKRHVQLNLMSLYATV